MFFLGKTTSLTNFRFIVLDKDADFNIFKVRVKDLKYHNLDLQTEGRAGEVVGQRGAAGQRAELLRQPGVVMKLEEGDLTRICT